MAMHYVLCIISVLWLQSVTAAPANDVNNIKMADDESVEDVREVDKRSTGDFPVFGAAGNLQDRPMVDWNAIYNNKRNAMKRFALGGEKGNFNGLEDKMVDWQKVFNKRQWVANQGKPFGAGAQPLSNVDMVNWERLFSKRAGLKRFGNSQNGLGDSANNELQKWAAFGRYSRSVDQQ